MNTQEAWDYIVENGIATEEELNLITGINGYNLETLNDVCEYRSGESLPEDDEEEEECGHNDQELQDDRTVVCLDCGKEL